MKSKKLLYAFAGLVFVGGLAFAFSSTEFFKGSFDLSALTSGPTVTTPVVSTGGSTVTSGGTSATIFDLRWDSDGSYDEDSNVFSVSMCIDDGAGDPSFVDDVEVDYYIYNDGGSGAVQSGVYTVVDFHRDASNTAGDCQRFDLFTVDETLLDDSEFRVSYDLRLNEDADPTNNGRGKDLSDSDVGAGTNLYVENMSYSEEDDLLTVDMCFEGEEPDASLTYHADLDYSGDASYGTSFQVNTWASSPCYTMNYRDFVATYELSGSTDVSVSVDTLDVITEADGDDAADNELSDTFEFAELEDGDEVNIEMVDAWVDGSSLYSEFNVYGDSATSYDFYLTAEIAGETAEIAFSMTGGQSMDGLVFGDMTTLFELDASVLDSGGMKMTVTLDETNNVEESDEGDNSTKVELNSEFLELLVSEETDVEEDAAEEDAYDYESVAREVLVEGYGLDEGRIEESMNKLVEEARDSAMDEQDFLEALSELAEDIQEEMLMDDYDYRAVAEELLFEGYGLTEEQVKEEMNDLLDRAQSERMPEEEFLMALNELAQDKLEEMEADEELEEEEGMTEKQLDQVREEFEELFSQKDEGEMVFEEILNTAQEKSWTEEQLREELSSVLEELKDKEEEPVKEEELSEETVDVAEVLEDFSRGVKGSDKRELEQVLDEALESGTLDEEDVEAVVAEADADVEEDDDLDEMIAALEAAIAAANSAASSASSAASAAQSAASSASSSGSSSGGSKDVVVNIDLGDYVSGSTSSSTSTTETTTETVATTESASTSPFSDVEAGTWYGDAMIALNEEGIMEGSNGKAYPWEYGNRAELVVLVMRAFYDESVLSKMNFDHEFEDVPSTKWYAMYLSAAVEFDILEAKDEFRPSESMTRAEFVTVLVRAANELCTTCDANFSDVSQKDWYYRAVATALSADLVSGYEDGSFKPNAKINRAQVASILYKALQAGWLD